MSDPKLESIEQRLRKAAVRDFRDELAAVLINEADKVFKHHNLDWPWQTKVSLHKTNDLVVTKEVAPIVELIIGAIVTEYEPHIGDKAVRKFLDEHASFREKIEALEESAAEGRF